MAGGEFTEVRLAPGGIRRRDSAGTFPLLIPDTRSVNLDILRALAALYVLADHAYSLSGSTTAFTDRNPWHLVVDTGTAGVWLFFALSGYLIAQPFLAALMTGAPLPSIASFGLRRVARIWPAYIIAFTVVITSGLPAGARPPVWQYPVHYLLLHNLVPGQEEAILSVAWTLSLEALFYLFVPAAAWLTRRFRSGPIPAVTVAGAVIALWVASTAWLGVADLVPQTRNGLWLREVFPAMLGPFCPGMLVAIGVTSWRTRDTPPGVIAFIARHRRSALAAIVGLGAAGAYATTDLHPLGVYDSSRVLFALASGIILILALTRPAPTGAVGRVLAWLGLISYGIYLWQGVILNEIERHHPWIPFPHPGVGAYLVHLIYLAVLTIPVAALSWYLIEYPVLKRVKRYLASDRAGSSGGRRAS